MKRLYYFLALCIWCMTAFAATNAGETPMNLGNFTRGAHPSGVQYTTTEWLYLSSGEAVSYRFSIDHDAEILLTSWCPVIGCEQGVTLTKGGSMVEESTSYTITGASDYKKVLYALTPGDYVVAVSYVTSYGSPVPNTMGIDIKWRQVDLGLMEYDDTWSETRTVSGTWAYDAYFSVDKQSEVAIYASKPSNLTFHGVNLRGINVSDPMATFHDCDNDGCTFFYNIPPGRYRMRSRYSGTLPQGVPITNSITVRPIQRNAISRNIGEYSYYPETGNSYSTAESLPAINNTVNYTFQLNKRARVTFRKGVSVGNGNSISGFTLKKGTTTCQAESNTNPAAESTSTHTYVLEAGSYTAGLTVNLSTATLGASLSFLMDISWLNAPAIVRRSADLGEIANGGSTSRTYTDSNSANTATEVTRTFTLKDRANITFTHEYCAGTVFQYFTLYDTTTHTEYIPTGTGVPGSNKKSYTYKLYPGNYTVKSLIETGTASCQSKLLLAISWLDNNTDAVINTNANYVLEVNPLDAVGAINYQGGTLSIDRSGGDAKEALINIRYFDGLGRPIQTVNKSASPQRSDLVDRMEYDNFGREWKAWLPVVINSNGTNTNFLSSILTASQKTYNNDSKAYAESSYEKSIESRPTQQSGPGENWINNNRAIVHGYTFNEASGALACLKYTCSGRTTLQVTSSGNYPANSLYINKVEDENGSIGYEFKNALAQTVLMRQMGGANNNTPHDTYYIYDTYGNQRVVLPPLASDLVGSDVNQLLEGSHVMTNLAYLYKYDDLNRCISAKQPGADWVHYVYDKAGQLIFTQDGEQRLKSEWFFSIPDAYGRVALTGICKNSLNYASSPLNNVIVKAAYPLSGTGAHLGYTITGVSLTSASLTITTITSFAHWQVPPILRWLIKPLVLLPSSSPVMEQIPMLTATNIPDY